MHFGTNANYRFSHRGGNVCDDGLQEVDKSFGKPHPTKVMLLSTADWDCPLWTNKQYMACELASAFPVTYVESLGLRRPEFSVRDLKRVVGRISKLFRGRHQTPGRERPTNLSVLSPIVIPYHQGPVRWLNRMLLLPLSRRWSSDDQHTKVLWTFTPLTYGLDVRSDVCVYHCVDLLAEFPGVDADAIARGERRLARRGVVAVASSQKVAAHLRRMGFRQVVLWPNVAEVNPFLQVNTVRNKSLVAFGGNLSPHKFNAGWMLELLDSCPTVTMEIAGPVADGGGRSWPELKTLLTHSRVNYRGVLDLAGLSEMYGRSSVGVIPYVENSYTNGVNPLKIAEYFAAGLPVVSSNVPAVGDLLTESPHLVDDLDVVSDVKGFVDSVITKLETPTAEAIERRRAEAALMSWGRRGVEARRLVNSLTDQRRVLGPRRYLKVGKRIVDLIGSTCGLLLFAPLVGVVALLVLFSDGRPVMFRQLRVGRNGEPFTIYKFRTMRRGAEQEIMSGSALGEQYRAEGFKLGKWDPRITRLGRWLRRTSIDELPQFWNVLRGDMSLVGIRPLLAEELQLRSQSEQDLYMKLRPGLTGLWQISGRSTTSEMERRAMDCQYVETHSLRRDLQLLGQTIVSVMRRCGAC